MLKYRYDWGVISFKRLLFFSFTYYKYGYNINKEDKEMKLINRVRNYNIKKKIKNANENLEHLYDKYYDNANSILNGTFIITKNNKIYYIVQSHLEEYKLLFYGIDCTAGIAACSLYMHERDAFIRMPQILFGSYLYKGNMIINLIDINVILKDKDNNDQDYGVFGIYRFGDIMRVIFNESHKEYQSNAFNTYNEIFAKMIPSFTSIFSAELVDMMDMDADVIVSPNIRENNTNKESEFEAELEPHSMIVTPDEVYYVKECIKSLDDAHIINGFMVNNDDTNIIKDICHQIVTYNQPTVKINMAILISGVKICDYKISKNDIIFILTKNKYADSIYQSIASDAYENTKLNCSPVNCGLPKYTMKFDIEHIIGVNIHLVESALNDYMILINSAICTEAGEGSIISTKNHIYYIIDMDRDDIRGAFYITGFVLLRAMLVISPSYRYINLDMGELLKGASMVYDHIVPYDEILFILNQSKDSDIDIYQKVHGIFNFVSLYRKTYKYIISNSDIATLYRNVVTYDIISTNDATVIYDDKDTRPIGDDINAFSHLQEDW